MRSREELEERIFILNTTNDRYVYRLKNTKNTRKQIKETKEIIKQNEIELNILKWCIKE